MASEHKQSDENREQGVMGCAFVVVAILFAVLCVYAIAVQIRQIQEWRQNIASRLAMLELRVERLESPDAK